MKTKGFAVTTAIIIALAILCAGICGWQTAHLISSQAVFTAEHPDYVAHSWYLLILLLATAVLACGQLVLRRKQGHPLLCGGISAGLILLGVLVLRAAADQHYHLGMLISDYGIQIPFEGGWLLLLLAAVLIIVTIAQLLTVCFSALAKPTEK